MAHSAASFHIDVSFMSEADISELLKLIEEEDPRLFSGVSEYWGSISTADNSCHPWVIESLAKLVPEFIIKKYPDVSTEGEFSYTVLIAEGEYKYWYKIENGICTIRSCEAPLDLPTYCMKCSGETDFNTDELDKLFDDPNPVFHCLECGAEINLDDYNISTYEYKIPDPE